MWKSVLKTINRWMGITDCREVGNGKYDIKSAPGDWKEGLPLYKSGFSKARGSSLHLQCEFYLDLLRIYLPPPPSEGVLV